MRTLFYPMFTFLFLSIACRNISDCRELRGRWTTHEGQELIFQPDGNALWLTKFGSQYDTVRLHFHFDCAARPATLDLSDFQSGAYSGKTLFGIFDWNSDSTFRWRYEAGTQPGVRPQSFDVEQTLRFSVAAD